jgi:fructose-1,6-bisphosphatase/inositol monophosphatase family enzyme
MNNECSSLTENLKKMLLQLALESNKIVRNVEISTLNSDKDIVTKADVLISTMISEEILRTFPSTRVETEELGVRCNSTREYFYFAVDDIDGTDNYYRGNGMLPYCTCICAFQGKDITRHASGKRLFQDMIAGCCIEHTTQTIFYAESGNGVQCLDINFKSKELIYPKPSYNCDKSTRILTDLYGGKPQRLKNLYESTWVKDFGSSAIHYCMAAIGLFDGLVFETYKAHELGLAYIFAKENKHWLSDFSLNQYETQEYRFTGSYEVLIAHNRKLAEKLAKMVDAYELT